MKKALTSFGIIGLFLLTAFAAAGSAATVSVDAGKILVERPNSLIGANIEDLNFQLYGGLYSQLLHGECFEEQLDPTELFGLEGPQRFAVWVMLDDQGQPVLRNFTGRSITPFYEPEGPVDWRASGQRGPATVKVRDLDFRDGVILPGELPGDLGRRLVELAAGNAQVSRHWRIIQSGSAAGAMTLVRQGVWTGKQAQQIRFLSGEGDLGIANGGLFHEGINIVGGQPYEGLLRIAADATCQVFVSLRNASGAVLAEEALDIAAQPGVYQRLTFRLQASASDPRGSFALTLRRPATITVDYAFLQAGEWGRFKGLPVRKDFAEALTGMGVKTMRYNGSMVNRNPAGAKFYKWKQMIAPRDERQPYHGFFNPYASHGFSVFEFMDFCEAAGIFPLFGLRIDETEQDLADLVEYCQGGADTVWGRRRTADGHPQPYCLKAVQIGNEQVPNDEYLARFKALASSLWSRNSNLVVLASVNVLTLANEGAKGRKAQGQKAGLDTMLELARWIRAQGREDRFVLDSHYQSTVDHADTRLADAVGLKLHERLARELPGFSLRLWPMEENGDRCTWQRGLAHAHNLNTMNRMPACLERAGVANSFQPWNLALIWNQGRIHYTPSQIYFQPSYYVDRMFADEWLPLVVKADCDMPSVDVLAKKSPDGKILTLYLVNIANSAAPVSFKVSGFTPKQAQVMRIGSERLEAINTPDLPQQVAWQKVAWTWNASRPQMELPPQSFTTIRCSSN